MDKPRVVSVKPIQRRDEEDDLPKIPDKMRKTVFDDDPKETVRDVEEREDYREEPDENAKETSAAAFMFGVVAIVIGVVAYNGHPLARAGAVALGAGLVGLGAYISRLR